MIYQERIAFLRNALCDPQVAAVTMSSTWVTRGVLRRLPATADTIVEQGAGTGALTRLLLERMTPKGRLFAIEHSPAFADHLGSIDDPRLTVVERRAEDLRYAALGVQGGVDAVISSIPFSFLTPDDRWRVVAAAYEALRPGGVLVVFHQYTWQMRRYLCARFSTVRVAFEPRNVFPCFILQAIK